MAKKSRSSGKHGRVIVTPARVTNLASGEGLTYWKQILPESEIHYTADGESRVIDFDRKYLTDLAAAFEEQALQQTPFVLADADNRHTMDPERYRGEVTKMVLAEDLPESAKTALAEDGEVPKGLYGKLKFSSKKDAEAVLRNPRLGVSARIREGVERADDGKRFRRAIIHVLGTLDPKVTRLGAWTPALDFSSRYDLDDVLDLSTADYSEVPVAKNKGKGKAAPATAEVPDLADLTEDDIEEMTDEQLGAFLEKYGHLVDTDPVGDEDDDEDEDDSEGEGAEDRELQEAALSANANRDITLAQQTAQQANDRALSALKRAAAAEWRETSSEYLRAGVPPHLIELAKPILSRPDEMVVDLSNTDDEDVNVSKIVRGLLDAARGTVDLSVEKGHGGGFTPGGEDDPDAEILSQFEDQFPL